MSRRTRWITFGGLVALGTVMLFISTLGLIPLDGGLVPTQGVFRSTPEIITDYVLIDVDGADQPGYDPPWYWTASSKPSYRLVEAPAESDIPAAVYARSTPTLDQKRAAQMTRVYNTLRGVQFGGLPLLFIGGVGITRLLGDRRKRVL